MWIENEWADAGFVSTGSVHAFLAEHRHRLVPEGLFGDLFPTTGAAVSPG